MKNQRHIIRKPLFFLITLLFVFPEIRAQESTQGFSYQAVARNQNGQPFPDTELTVRIGIENTEGKELIWQEEHAVTTSSLGLFTLTVGDPGAMNQGGSAGTFDRIDWSVSKSLHVWIKSSGDFVDMGSSPLVTVPLAKYASSAGSATGNFSIQPNEDPAEGEALFVVKRRDGQPVFAVYEDMVWVYVDTVEKKGVRGGFAVGGFTKKKGVTEEYMRVTPDSVRVYISDDGSKGVRGGFAVGGYPKKATKGSGDLYFNLSPETTMDLIDDKSQILFYPKKDAFFAGTIHVGDPDSVGTNSTSLGFKAIAKGQNSQGFGYKSRALGNFSTAIGQQAVALEENSFALGNTTKALGPDSYAFGSGARASGERSFAFGSVGIDTLGMPTGVPTSATGDYSIAFGMGARALENGAMSFGASSTADGFQSVAIGSGTTASGSYATGIGYRSQAEGYKSIAIGAHYSYSLYIPNLPLGKGSTSAGGTEEPDDIIFPSIIKPPVYIYKPRTITSYNRAVGDYSISIGNGNYSSDGGLAIGTYNYSYNQGSVALGVSNISREAYSFTAGYNNEATGYYSMALGENLTSQAQNSFVIGRFNELTGDTANWRPTDPLFVIGNGSSSTDRHDALRVAKNGGTYIYPQSSYYGLRLGPENSRFGIYLYSSINSDYSASSLSTIYGQYTSINGNISGRTIYSGYFTGSAAAGSTYNGLYANTRTGAAIDLAEYIYDSRGNTQEGDVVVADPAEDESVLLSSSPYQSSVLGVVSTRPHMIMGMERIINEETGETIDGVQATRLTLTGRVPVKFSEENGSIKPGDLLTSSSTPGKAMKWSLLDVNTANDFEEMKSILAENERRRNAIIGKALSGLREDGTVIVLVD